MMHTIEYSPDAIRDLDRVWDEVFEASKSVEISTRYVNDLLDEVAKRKEFPESASRLYYNDMFTGYYYVVFKAYIAFYFIENDRVRVMRVLFGRSDYMRELIKL